MKKLSQVWAVVFCLPFCVLGQKTNQRMFVEVNIKPDHPDWVYHTKQDVVLELTVTKGGERCLFPY